MPYADLVTLKDMLGITGTSRDFLLEAALDAASASIDQRCGRAFGKGDAPSPRVFRVRGRVTPFDGGSLLLVDDIATLDGLMVETGRPGDWVEITDAEPYPDNAL